MLIDSFTKKDYTQHADKLVAINPRWQKQVKKWGKAMRLVDYWVDLGYVADDFDDKKHYQECLDNEEKYWNQVQEIEFSLPKREIENAVRQLTDIVNAQFVNDLVDDAYQQGKSDARSETEKFIDDHLIVVRG
jgi:hypothetical protein